MPELSRRAFLGTLGLAAAGAIVAPTLAQVAETNKKYFFIGGRDDMYDALRHCNADLWVWGDEFLRDMFKRAAESMAKPLGIDPQKWRVPVWSCQEESS